ncbi:hypothetical protein [Stetteria hydrogenophila]
MASLSAEDIVKLFEEDVRARKRLAELLVSEPDVRLTVINAVLRDVATKHDIERLREEFRRELEARIEGLRRELDARLGEVDKRIDALDKRIDSLDKRIEALERRVDALGERVGSLERGVEALKERIDEMGKRLDYIAKVTLALTGTVLAALIVAIVELALA